MKKLVVISPVFLSAILLFAVSCDSNTKSTVTQPAYQYDVAAFYWPAYHPDPRFKDIGVFPDGKGEWEAIYKAKPKFPGHAVPRVPLWGYQDESLPAVMEQKIEAAVKYGVNVLIFDWYWYDKKPFLEDALNKGFLQARNNRDIRFSLMWANHDHNSYLDPANPDKSKVYWYGGVTLPIFETMIDHVIHDYFKQPNYYKIDGKPVFSIYELSTFIKGIGGSVKAREALELFRKKTREAGFPDLHLQSILWGTVPSSLTDVPNQTIATQNAVLSYFGFNSLTNYQWVHSVAASGDYGKWGEAAIQQWKQWDTSFTMPFFPHVSIGWDNNPRFPVDRQGLVENTTPEQFKSFLEQARSYIDAHPAIPKLITINAWNEWAEGSYLEPDTTNRFKYLEAIRSVFPRHNY